MSERWTVRIPADVAAVIRTLAPEHKRRIRAALKVLEQNGRAGKPLLRELASYRSMVVKPFRIIYSLDGREVRIKMIDRRETVYEILASSLSAAERARRYAARRAKKGKS